MQYAPQALLSCVVLFSLLSYGNAARGVAPSTDVLSHFASVVGTVLEPALTEREKQRRQPKIIANVPASNRSPIKPRQVANQEAGVVGANPIPSPFQNQVLTPFQYEQRGFPFRYPATPYSVQQIVPNFYAAAGLGGLGHQLPVDPRFFQQFAINQQFSTLRSGSPKVLNNINNNNNNNNDDVKTNSNGNANSIQNNDSNADSKSSAQNRPVDSADFSPFNRISSAGGINAGDGAGLDPNLRVDGRFLASDYERIRQNYNGNPSIDEQRNYYSSINEIPLSSGSPYRSEFSNLNLNGQVGSSGGVGNPYLGSFLQGFGYNGAGEAEGGFRRAAGFGSLGVSQFPASYNTAPFIPGGGADGLGFHQQDSSLRASSAKETVSETEAPAGNNDNYSEDPPEQRASAVEEEFTTRVSRASKVQFIDEKEKARSSES